MALNGARGLVWVGDRRLFLNMSTAIVPARITVSRATAHITRVLGRSQAVPLRTAYCSRPTSPWAASKLLSTVQRLPATRTTASSVVGGGANTT